MSQERAMKVGHSDDLEFSIRGEEMQGTRYFNLHRIMYYQANT